MDRNKELCLQLAQVDTEESVIELLKKYEYWDNTSCWKLFGGKPNNFSTIGNQQSSADSALVEKITNSVDAVLMRECLKRKIHPESKQAPQSLEEALKKFFHIPGGKLANVDIRLRRELSKNIALIITGSKSNPTYAIIDKGEGISPSNFPSTILSLNETNKLKIPFVQGKFNMGGTGALRFCGKNKMQLIISKRNPDIPLGEISDLYNDYWGFTIVRREKPPEGMKNSIFTYLAPNNNILRFKADFIPIAPKIYPYAYGNPFRFGTYIKLYEYDLKGLKTLATLDLYYRLSLLLPGLGLPIIVFERRKGYSGHTLQSIMSGLNVRLEEDKRENLEHNFPSYAEIRTEGEKMDVLIYAFKKNQMRKYSPKEGIIFTVNGQSHGFISNSFYERKNVGMAYLKDSILILIDCSKLSQESKEDLFMSSRDRLSEGGIKIEIEHQLEELIRNHEGLRALREKRRREELEDVLKQSKPLADVINKIIKKSPTLSKLLLRGFAISNPFNLTKVGTKKDYKGKKYPTYFKLVKKYDNANPKYCHSGSKFRIQFETDSENDYFKRDNDPGTFSLTVNNNKASNFILNLWNGLATLTIALPTNVNIGEIINFNTVVSDRTQIASFENKFYVKVVDPKLNDAGDKGEREQPPNEKKGEDRAKLEGLALPKIKECRKSDGENYKFKDDEEGALIVIDAGDNNFDFYVNLDNVYLKTEMKGLIDTDPKLLEAQFKYANVLIGLSLLNENQRNNTEEDKSSESIYNKIYFFSKAVSPILLPMITNLGDLSLEGA